MSSIAFPPVSIVSENSYAKHGYHHEAIQDAAMFRQAIHNLIEPIRARGEWNRMRAMFTTAEGDLRCVQWNDSMAQNAMALVECCDLVVIDCTWLDARIAIFPKDQTLRATQDFDWILDLDL